MIASPAKALSGATTPSSARHHRDAEIDPDRFEFALDEFRVHGSLVPLKPEVIASMPNQFMSSQ